MKGIYALLFGRQGQQRLKSMTQSICITFMIIREYIYPFPLYHIYITSQQQHERLPIGKNAAFNFFLQLLLQCPVFFSSPYCITNSENMSRITREELLTSFLSLQLWMSSSLRLPELTKTFESILREVHIHQPGGLYIRNLNR